MRLAPQRIKLRAGDDLPGFSGIVEDDNGSPVDLTDSVCTIRVRHPDGTITEDIATIVSGPAGAVTYDWTGTQTRNWGIGEHEISLRADWTAGDQLTTSPDRNCALIISPEIAVS